jgi:hypothetical protein
MSDKELEVMSITMYRQKEQILDMSAAITGYRQYNQEAHRLLKEVLKSPHLELRIRERIIAMTGCESGACAI